MEAWGWRIPFLLGGILGPVGLWMRRTIDETPAYTKAAAAPLARHRRPPSRWLLAARAFGFTIVWTVCFYVLLNYMPTYTQKYVKLSASAALWSNTIGLLALMVVHSDHRACCRTNRPQAAAARLLRRLHRAALPDLQLSCSAAPRTPS